MGLLCVPATGSTSCPAFSRSRLNAEQAATRRTIQRLLASLPGAYETSPLQLQVAFAFDKDGEVVAQVTWSKASPTAPNPDSILPARKSAQQFTKALCQGQASELHVFGHHTAFSCYSVGANHTLAVYSFGKEPSALDRSLIEQAVRDRIEEHADKLTHFSRES